MATYRKKPVEIQARQYANDGSNAYELIDWIDQDAPGNDAVFDPDDNTVCIKTLEGVMAASLGDWIIRGVQGEFYPCKPDIFEATYELVEAPELSPQEREVVRAFGIHEEDR
jgi:hypothetical protein